MARAAHRGCANSALAATKNAIFSKRRRPLKTTRIWYSLRSYQFRGFFRLYRNVADFPIYWALPLGGGPKRQVDHTAYIYCLPPPREMFGERVLFSRSRLLTVPANGWNLRPCRLSHSLCSQRGRTVSSSTSPGGAFVLIAERKRVLMIQMATKIATSQP